MNNIKNLYLDLPKQHKIIISVFTLIFMLILMLPSEKATAGRQTKHIALEVGKRYQLTIPQKNMPSLPINSIASFDNTDISTATTELTSNQPDQLTVTLQESGLSNEITLTEEDIAESLHWDTAKVKSGDSLAKILKRFGYTANTTYKVSHAKGENTSYLNKLSIGDTLTIGKNESGQLSAITYPLSKTKTLFVNLNDKEYVSRIETKTVEIREATARGIIHSNFWSAGISAGLDDNQIINLANIFGWDIDFALDIRKGDSFHVVYEDKYVDGEYIGTGKILAAEFTNQKEQFQAIRFSNGEYYSASGKSMRKAFLRAPVNFRYISSNFNPKRFHPIQKKFKAHNGTDYSAKVGTPVVAAGNGRVKLSAYNKYNGHHVFIQHGNGIETKYLHFSKRKVKKGQRVKQGEVIGYVGSTGMSEAPHLHYEFLVNNVHRDPRTVKLPNANPLHKKYKAEFAALSQKRMSEIAGSKQVMLTMLATKKE